jgi:hypothetical protein
MPVHEQKKIRYFSLILKQISLLGVLSILMSQFTPKNFTQVIFRQGIAEFDSAFNLFVGRDFGINEGLDFSVADRFHSRFPDDESSGKFTCMFIGDTDHSGFHDSRMSG